jgi:CBS domain-containing protein
MQAKAVMTHPVISVSTRASILEAVRLMLQHKISGLPVFDESGKLAGIVSDGDFLRRAETDTLRRRPRWIEFFVGPGKLADEYVHASTRKVSEVMTAEVHTVSENAPLNEVVTIMEQNHIKRVPVMHREELVGIVTRTDLLRALINGAKPRCRRPMTSLFAGSCSRIWLSRGGLRSELLMSRYAMESSRFQASSPTKGNAERYVLRQKIFRGSKR